jgi:hypothetical protein
MSRLLFALLFINSLVIGITMEKNTLNIIFVSLSAIISIAGFTLHTIRTNKQKGRMH